MCPMSVLGALHVSSHFPMSVNKLGLLLYRSLMDEKTMMERGCINCQGHRASKLWNR